MKNGSTSIVAALLAGGLVLGATGCASNEEGSSAGIATSTATATKTSATKTEQATPVAASVSCAALIGDDGGLITRSGEFLQGVTELSAKNGEAAEGFSEEFAEVSRTASKELQEPIAVMRDELDGLAAAITTNTDYQLVLDDYASAGQEVIDICSGAEASKTATPTTPTRTSAPAPTPSEDSSVARGSTKLEVITSEFGHEGYTLDYEWAITDPGQTEVLSVEGDKLGSSDLSLSFDSAMRFVNTTEGSRTFNFDKDGGVSLVLRYPSGSPVCDYAPNRADDGTSCFVDTWDGSIVGVRFSDFSNRNEIVQGEATNQVDTTHDLTLRDVPEAEVGRVSEALPNYESVIFYLHYGDTTDVFKTNCDQSALEGMGFASIYLVLATLGSKPCPA